MGMSDVFASVEIPGRLVRDATIAMKGADTTIEKGMAVKRIFRFQRPCGQVKDRDQYGNGIHKRGRRI